MLHYSEKMAKTMIERYPIMADLKAFNGKWSYDYGVVLKGFEALYKKTNKREYLEYIKNNIDPFIQEDGSINRYKLEDYNIDNINNGKLLFLLYEEYKEDKYLRAMRLLRSQLETHPRTSEGAFWHKKIYPYQIWLDGLYMAAPFYLEFDLKYEPQSSLDDITKQFILCEKHTLDSTTGLLYHAWDEKKIQPWCDSQTGLSKHFWGRSMGWFLMALVDVLEILPQDHKDYHELARIYKNSMDAVLQWQSEAGVWYQVLNLPDAKGNYLEASCSSMFTYALAKGLRLNLLDASYRASCDRAYQGLHAEFILETKEGWLNLNKNCEVAGLGGPDGRDGSYEYYISEPIVNNDFKGVGAYIQACAEYEGGNHDTL